jgi:hypothetical protein
MEKSPKDINADDAADPSKPRFSRRINKLLLVGVSVLVVLLAAEVLLRIAQKPVLWNPDHHVLARAWKEFLHQPSGYPAPAYEMKPGVDINVHGINVRTNRLGMRSDEFDPKKPALVRRIVVLGDSIAFGWGVEQDQTFSALLEKRLNRRSGRHFEVVNMAVSGYSTRDEVALFMRRGADLDPDLVVMEYFLNDPEIEPVQPLTAFYQPRKWWKQSNLLRLFRKAFWRCEIWKFGKGDYFRHLHEKPRTWNSVVTALTWLSIWSERLRTPVLVVIFPDVSMKEWPDYPYLEIHGKVSNTSRALGFYALDLYPVYSGYPRKTLIISEDDHHPSPFAHRLAAESLDAFMRKELPRLFRPE